MITRTTVTDDDGTGTTGTIANQAWLTTFYDTLDARWSRYTYTLTGAQNNLDVDEADVVLLNSASDSAITGLDAPASPAKPGKITIFKNIHATSVFTFAHNSGSSSAGKKFFNTVTSGVTPVSTGGWIAYQYDDVNSRWNLIAHEQGAWITPAHLDANYTGNTGTWTVTSGDVTNCRYRLRGRDLLVQFQLGTTTVVAALPTILQIGNAAWGGFTLASTGSFQATGFATEPTTGNLTAYLSPVSTTLLGFTKLTQVAWTASTNATYVYGQGQMEVT